MREGSSQNTVSRDCWVWCKLCWQAQCKRGKSSVCAPWFSKCLST